MTVARVAFTVNSDISDVITKDGSLERALQEIKDLLFKNQNGTYGTR